MPRIVDYPQVLETTRAMNLHAAYPNGGVFAFAKGVLVHHCGWLGPPDDTIRPAAREFAVQVPPPFEQNLLKLLIRAWQELVPGKAWMMPAHHWAYELDFGGKTWLPGILRQIGLDPQILAPLTTAAAIEFDPGEIAALSDFGMELFTKLTGSDFAVAFPGHSIVGLLHHHKQVWWSSSDAQIIGAISQIRL